MADAGTEGEGRSRAAADAGRRRRLNLDEVEDRVMATARDLLIRQTGGLAVGLGHINLEVIIAAAGVPRSSAYRRWPTKDDFVTDFLGELASNPYGTAIDSETVRRGAQVIQQNINQIDDKEDRKRILRESLRLGVRREFGLSDTSPEWRTYVALAATVMSIDDEEARDKILAKIQETEAALLDGTVSFYAGVASVLGLRPKPPYGFRHLAAAGAAVGDGLALRSMANPTLVRTTLPVPNIDGSGTADWTLAAASFLAIVELMIEDDPDYEAMTEKERADFAAIGSDQIVEHLISRGLAARQL